MGQRTGVARKIEMYFLGEQMRATKGSFIPFEITPKGKNRESFPYCRRYYTPIISRLQFATLVKRKQDNEFTKSF